MLIKNFFHINNNKKDFVFLILIAFTIFLLLFFSGFMSINNHDFMKVIRGNDYRYFYEKSKIIESNGIDKLYNIDQYKKNILNGLGFDPNYSQVVYYLFLPLSFLPYQIGAIINSIFFLGLYLASIILLISIFKRLHQYRFIILLISCYFFPFIDVFINNFISILWLFILAFSFYLAKKENLFKAGVIFSLFIINPVFYFVVLIILLFSFRLRLFLGFIVGSLALLLFSGVFDKFYIWSKWLEINIYHFQAFFNFDKFYLIKTTTKNLFFYPMNSKNIIISYIEYISMLFGLLSIISPIIYSFFHKNNFSRNSYWVIVSITLVLANPYFFIFDLMILIVPLLIVVNLMLADRVQHKYIILILIVFSLIIIVIFTLSLIILIQLFALILWFFLINGMLAVRIRKYTPKNFITYWDNY